MKFAEATVETVDAIEQAIGILSDLPTLEGAAQELAGMLYEGFPESALLARVFVTVPFQRLPAPNQEFVLRWVGPGRRSLVKPNTSILSLVGTRGCQPRWNSRHDSVGHAAVPLVSMEFVDSIPMIARLLKELGATLEWARELDTAIVTHSLGRVAGAFYVDEASTAVDHQGRHIIAEQDFVQRYGVQTVFGFGGAYPVHRAFLAVVVFTTEMVERRQVQRFMRLANSFKAATLRLVREGRIFDTAADRVRGSQAG